MNNRAGITNNGTYMFNLEHGGPIPHHRARIFPSNQVGVNPETFGWLLNEAPRRKRMGYSKDHNKSHLHLDTKFN
jgi:hypothetical protein